MKTEIELVIVALVAKEKGRRLLPGIAGDRPLKGEGTNPTEHRVAGRDAGIEIARQDVEVDIGIRVAPPRRRGAKKTKRLWPGRS